MTEIRVVVKGADNKRWELRYLTDSLDAMNNVRQRMLDGGYTAEQVAEASFETRSVYTTLLQGSRELAENER